MRITDDVDLKLLSQTPLFSYLSRDEISDITDALQCSIRNYKRGEVLMQSGGHTDYSGLVLKGRVIIKTAPNLDGGQKIMAEIGLGEMYGEPFNCLSYSAVPITVIAKTDVRVFIVDVRNIFQAKLPTEIFSRLLSNLVIQFAEKIVVFRNKIEVLSQPSVKMKVLTTIKQYAEYQNTLSPVIPFSKVDFSEYLAVGRNTIAKAIDELIAEGTIRVEGKRYELLKPENIMFVQRSEHSPANAIHAQIRPGGPSLINNSA